MRPGSQPSRGRSTDFMQGRTQANAHLLFSWMAWVRGHALWEPVCDDASGLCISLEEGGLSRERKGQSPPCSPEPSPALTRLPPGSAAGKQLPARGRSAPSCRQRSGLISLCSGGRRTAGREAKRPRICWAAECSASFCLLIPSAAFLLVWKESRAGVHILSPLGRAGESKGHSGNL